MPKGEADEDVVMSGKAEAPSAGKAEAPSAGAGAGAGRVSAAPTADVAMELPWVEKYRPRVLGDVVGNEETIGRLRVIAKHGNMPNLILAGPPGTGKTTSVWCLAYEMLGDAAKEAVLELNASDDRGIDVVRNRIKQFAKQKVTLPPGRCKIVILDEADSMTSAAQQALRRTMELYSSTTRFALACNTSSKIIEPIQSRCAILRFTRLSDSEVMRRVMHVVRAEGIHRYTEDGLEAILFTAQGDMRGALNNLQATWSGQDIISAESVYKVVDQPHPVVIKTIVDACVAGLIRDALPPVDMLWRQGYAAIDVVGTLFRVVKYYDMSEELKLEFIRTIGFAHMRIADGCDTHLQLNGLIARLAAAGAASKSGGRAPVVV